MLGQLRRTKEYSGATDAGQKERRKRIPVSRAMSTTFTFSGIDGVDSARGELFR
jgi:hypothetical protein